MKQFVFFDDPQDRQQLLPFTYTRPIAEIRCGIHSIREKWQSIFPFAAKYITADYLQSKFHAPDPNASESIWIRSDVMPDPLLIDAVRTLKYGQAIFQNGVALIAKTDGPISANFRADELDKIEFAQAIHRLRNSWDIFQMNGPQIELDFSRLCHNRHSQPLSSTNTVIGDPSKVFLEEGAWVEAAVLNTLAGPIYIGRSAEVMEGSLIRGPFSLAEFSSVKMGAKIYGPTTIGPHCKVGGEINNSVLFGYSNKAHDGFMGNSVIGEWCNWGADSNNSNLKNNYEIVKLWNYSSGRFASTGTQFCGLMMGDHSKCGINTMFNTGTVIGICCNIFGDGFPRNFIPDFSWGGAAGFTEYKFEKAMETVARVMERRQLNLDDANRAILKAVYDLTASSRKAY